MTLPDLVSGSLESAILIFVRVAALFALAPITGERALPPRVKLGGAFAVTILIFPLIAPVTPQTNALPAAILTEAATGLTFGLIFRLLVIAIQMAGIIIAQSGSLAQMFPGMVDDAAPAVASLLNTLALALAASLGLQFVLIEVLVKLYDIFPVGQGITAAQTAETMVSSVAQATVLAFKLSAGFVIASLLYNLLIGFANRVMPQLMLTMIGAPVISIGTLLLLMLTFPLILEAWISATENLLAGYK